MTVIAYRDGVMVGDGRVTSNKTFVENDRDVKVFKLADGSLLGLAGTVTDCLIIKETLTAVAKEKKKGLTKKLPDLSRAKKGECLFVGPAGDIWFLCNGVWEELKLDYTACGSGYIIALAAMDAGASAKKAVEIACKRNNSCGGKLTVVKL